MNRGRGSSERGFGIVEVVVAALIVLVVVSGITAAVASSGRGRQVTGTQTLMKDRAEQAYEKLRSNTAWTTTGDCAVAVIDHPCEVPAVLTPTELRDRTGAVQFELSTVAVPRDLPADRSAVDDEDGVTIDAWDIRVRVSTPAAAAARLGNPRPYVLRGSLNANDLTRQGGLVVQFCAASAQRDERIQFGACNGSGDVLIPECATASEDCSVRTSLLPFVPTPLDQPAARVRIQFARPPAFTLTGPGGATYDKGDATPIDALGAQVPLGSEVAYQFRNLPNGEYEVSGSLPGFVPWESHSIPAGGKVNVERGTRSRALVAFKRPDSAGQMAVHFSRRTHQRTWSGNTRQWTSPWGPTCDGGGIGRWAPPVWYQYQGCDMGATHGRVVFAERIWSPGRYPTCPAVDENGDPVTCCPSSPAMWADHCWYTDNQLVGDSRFHDHLTWHYVQLGGTAMVVRRGAAADSSVTTASTPLSRSALSTDPDGDELDDDYYEPGSTVSPAGGVRYVGNPAGLNAGMPMFYNTWDAPGRSSLRLRPGTRGMHVRETPTNPAVGPRTAYTGPAQQCATMLWVRPTNGSIGCTATYTGNGECYERLTGAVFGNYGWRVEPCAGTTPDNCVRWLGVERCGMGVLLYRKCVRRTLETEWDMYGSGSASAPSTTTTRNETTCTNLNPPLVCTNTLFTSCHIGSPPSANINAPTGGRNTAPPGPRSSRAPAKGYLASDPSA